MSDYIWLANGLGPASKRFLPILHHFGSPQEVFENGRESDFLTTREKERLFGENAVKVQPLARLYGFIDYADSRYPAALRDLPDPPPVLYYRGDLSLLQKHRVSVVGARKADAYGRELTGTFAASLARAGIAVVSGVAAGADTAAHEGALSAGAGTIAVLPSGFLHIAPQSAVGLTERIAAAGLLLSEYPPDTPVYKASYHQRNRLIAAIGQALFVPQCKAGGGSLLTVDSALHLKRPVFALPCDVRSHFAAGFSELLHCGAVPAVFPQDIIQTVTGEVPVTEKTAKVKKPSKSGHTYGEKPAPSIKEDTASSNPQKPFSGTPLQEKLVALLQDKPSRADELSERAQAPPAAVLSELSLLELMGTISRGLDGTYHVML